MAQRDQRPHARPKNPRHETFAYEIAKGSSAVDAYRNAGYKAGTGAYHCAHRLLKKVEIDHRVVAIREKLSAKSDICAEDVVRMLLEDRELAREKGQAAAAIQADMGIAKVLGFITNKSEARVEVGFHFSPEEALAKLGEQKAGGRDPGGAGEALALARRDAAAKRLQLIAI